MTVRQIKLAAARIALAMLLCLLCSAPRLLQADDGSLRDEAVAAMRKAAEFYRNRVASHGGYVYYYSLDLQQRLGEGVASRDQIWVQPPGTPTVGMAYLRAFEATGDTFFLDAATEAAEALLYGQLRSGGWTNCIDFDPRGQRVAAYRNGKGRGKDNSTLDDGISQAAVRLLMHVDRAHQFNHRRIHEAAQIALEALLKAQFANGAFPQVWTGPVARQPISTANYPGHNWRTEGRIKNYWDMYTLNDGLAGTVALTLRDAHEIYGAPRYQAALKQLAGFLVLAQMPQPQPAWAQQYNYAMQPIWARRFEPAAIAGRESQDVMQALLLIARHTGEGKYLEPIPAALAYLKRSLLDDGRLARYYELRTNRPLYMSRRGKEYSLTYDDSKLPSHYGWKVESRLESIEQEYAELRRSRLRVEKQPLPVPEQDVRRIVGELDEQGRWISRYAGQPLVGQPKFPLNSRFIASQVFSDNLEALSKYIRWQGRSSG